MADIVNKLWGFCHTLRHDGIDYGDYIEQLTYLLFLKMADEKGLSACGNAQAGVSIPAGFDWNSLKDRSGTDLTDHYADILRKLREAKGILGDIFAQSMPRVLIQSIVNVMKPDPRANREFSICDPACGTGGFLMCAYEWLMHETGGALERKDIARVRKQTYYGQDLVPRPRRLALMNLFLHGLEPHIYLGDSIYEPDRGELYDCILTNPPFGTRGANQAPARDDFTIETSNKQLNFVQHVMTILKSGGRAAMVLPDNCLFEGKAGEVFKILMQDCNLHTILRLPRGTFTPYSQGVRANVIFFQKGRPTEDVWIFDARTNVPGVTKKDRPLSAKHFEEFEQRYGDDANGSSQRRQTGPDGRWRKFGGSEIAERDYKLDVTWLRDDSLEDADDLPEPGDLIADAITELEAVVDDLREMAEMIEMNGTRS